MLLSGIYLSTYPKYCSHGFGVYINIMYLTQTNKKIYVYNICIATKLCL